MGKLSGKLLLTKELRGRNTYEWQIGRSDCIDRYLGFDPHQCKQKFFWRKTKKTVQNIKAQKGRKYLQVFTTTYLYEELLDSTFQVHLMLRSIQSLI